MNRELRNRSYDYYHPPFPKKNGLGSLWYTAPGGPALPGAVSDHLAACALHHGALVALLIVGVPSEVGRLKTKTSKALYYQAAEPERFQHGGSI